MISDVSEYVERYRNISYQKEIDRDRFIREFVKDVNVRSFMSQLHDDLLFMTFGTDYMSHEYKDSHTCFFITLTLDSPFHHRSKIKSKDFVFDSDDDRIFFGYSLLQSCFRSVYRDFKINRKYVKDLKFARVIEPHKDFTPHLHALVYVPVGLEDNFLNHFENVLNNYQKKGIGKQFKIEKLRDTKSGSIYITKYMRKYMTDRSFDGWKRKHKIRVFTCSRLPIPRYVFKIISGRVVISDWEYTKKTSYIHGLLKSCYIKISDFDYYENKIREKIIGNRDSVFGVLFDRTRVVSLLPICDTLISRFSYYKIYKVRIIRSSDSYLVYSKDLNISTYKNSLEIFSRSSHFVNEIDFFENF